MQEADHTQLKQELVDFVTEKGFASKSKETIQSDVERKFKELSDQEKLLSLTEDEVRLLMDFRKWSASPGSASGVFHWRKQYGNRD